jgi:hypothetical protein
MLPVTDVTISTLASSGFDTRTTTLEVIVALLLIVLLIQKELLSAMENGRSRVWIQALNVAILPLLLVFGLIIGTRILHLLRLG